MKYYRYMSEEEFQKLQDGCILTNSVNHGYHARTNSIGFCFLAEDFCVEPDSDSVGRMYYFLKKKHSNVVELCKQLDEFIEEHTLHAWHALAFIPINENILVEFESNLCLCESFGEYANPFNDDWDSRIRISERCITEYSASTMRPTKYCILGERSDYMESYNIGKKYEDICWQPFVQIHDAESYPEYDITTYRLPRSRRYYSAE